MMILFAKYISYILLAISILCLIPEKTYFGYSVSGPRKVISVVLFIIGLLLLMLQIGSKYSNKIFTYINDQPAYRIMLPAKHTTCEVETNGNDVIKLFSSNDVYYVNAKIGNTNFMALFDTGCSYQMSMPTSYYNKLVKDNSIEYDLDDSSIIMISTANGKTPVYITYIKQVVIDGIEFKNIKCAVGNNINDFIIGCSLFNCFDGYVVDNKQQTIKIIQNK